MLNRLHGFLRIRIPLNRQYLLPGRHWVWDSLRGKLTKILAMMVLSKHIINYNDLKYRNNDECLLCNLCRFILVAALYDDDDLDGSYLVYDTKKGINLRSVCQRVA